MAVDYKFTGEEPIWEDVKNLSKEDVKSKLAKAFYFYAYYVENDDWKQILTPWLKKNGFTDNHISNLRVALKQSECMTAAKVIRCIQMGFPEKHSCIPTQEQLKSKFTQAFFQAGITATASQKDDATTTSSPGRISPIQATLNKTRETILVPLERLIDTWIQNKSENVHRVDMVKTLTTHQIPAIALPMVVAYLEKYRNEYDAALRGDDKQLKEAYAYLSKKALMTRIIYLNKMISDVTTFRGIKRATRKVRVKKTRSIESQIKNLKYQIASKEYKLSSISPMQIPGAQHLYVFNTKYKTVTVLHANNNDGLSIRGTTIQNFDDSSSYTQGLRKPEKTIPLILSKQPRAIEKEMESLSTKKRKANGRINENIIILKSIQSRSL